MGHSHLIQRAGIASINGLCYEVTNSEEEKGELEQQQLGKHKHWMWQSNLEHNHNKEDIDREVLC